MDTVWIKVDQPTMGIVFLHGLGASGADLASLSNPINDRLPNERIAWCFPQAAHRPVTLNDGMVMPAWFDIMSLDKEGLEDEAGIAQATDVVIGYIKAMHAQGIPYDRIVLCGFSQGGALALSTYLAHRPNLAMVASFSGYLPSCMRASVVPTSMPICLFHGQMDDVVAYRYAKVAYRWLHDQGHQVQLQGYPMTHAIDQDCLIDFIGHLESL